MNEHRLCCRDASDFLMRYLDGELSAEERKVFQGHLQACPACIDFLDSYKTTIELGKACAKDAPELPDALQNAIVDAMKKGKKDA